MRDLHALDGAVGGFRCLVSRQGPVRHQGAGAGSGFAAGSAVPGCAAVPARAARLSPPAPQPLQQAPPPWALPVPERNDATGIANRASRNAMRPSFKRANIIMAPK